MPRLFSLLPVIAIGLVLVGCSKDNTSEAKKSSAAAELAPGDDDDDDDDATATDTAAADDDDDDSTAGDFGDDDDSAAASPADTASANGGGTQSFEGRKVQAAGSINPPNPQTMCDAAKADAQSKATAAGFSGAVTWDHLSNDSDCKLSTVRAGHAGYYFIMTATGTFNQN